MSGSSVRAGTGVAATGGARTTDAAFPPPAGEVDSPEASGDDDCGGELMGSPDFKRGVNGRADHASNAAVGTQRRPNESIAKKSASASLVTERNGDEEDENGSDVGAPHPLSTDPFRHCHTDPKSLDPPEAFLASARTFLLSAASRPCRRLNKSSAKCTCLRDIAHLPSRLDAACAFLLDHARRNRGERQVVVKEWMRQGELVRTARGPGRKREPCYAVEGVCRGGKEEEERAGGEGATYGGEIGEGGEQITANGNGSAAPKKRGRKRKRPPTSSSSTSLSSAASTQQPFFVCPNAMALLCNLGHHQWSTLKRDMRNRAPLVHGLVGRRPNSSRVEKAIGVRAAMAQFLREMREENDNGGDDEDGGLSPPNKSMRSLYELFCYQRGYLIRRDRDGGYGRTSSYPVRPDWPSDSSPLPVLSKDVFDSVYNEMFPDAKDLRKRAVARADEERKRRLREVEKELKTERREKERERAQHVQAMTELEGRLAREREQHVREREMLLEEIVQLQGRIAAFEAQCWQ